MSLNKILLTSLLLYASNVIAAYISVDVGHSLKKYGTTSAYGDKEFILNKRMALNITNALLSDKNEVRLIAIDGGGISLQERASKASGDNLLISIHHDSVQEHDLTLWDSPNGINYFNDDISGFGIFVSKKNIHFQKSFDCAQRIASNLVRDGFKPNYYHAKNIDGERKNLLSDNYPVYQYDNLIILKSAKVPAILIEVGVATNRNEMRWLENENVRDRFSKAVSIGVKECLATN